MSSSTYAASGLEDRARKRKRTRSNFTIAFVHLYFLFSRNKYTEQAGRFSLEQLEKCLAPPAYADLLYASSIAWPLKLLHNYIIS